MKLKTYNNTKGISQCKSGSYEAYVVVRHATNKSKTGFKAYVGTFKTKIEAEKARIEYIKRLV